MRVQVVFLADVPPKHMAGDVRAVSGGYARNYLIPQGLAAPATADQLKRIAKIKSAAEAKRARDAADLKSVADVLEGLSVTLKGRSGQGGRLYGSITTMAIAQALTDAVGHDIDRRIISLTEPIRDLGTYQVPVRLHMDLIPTVTVVVEDAAGRYFAAVAEDAEEASDDEDAADEASGDEAAPEDSAVEDSDDESAEAEAEQASDDGDEAPEDADDESDEEEKTE
ncbi:MAG: 50S ribosomal protein L9 [Chloroflexota bacterium]|nr:50S ribosomal protein L9 [Chloroflexota bacterium]